MEAEKLALMGRITEAVDADVADARKRLGPGAVALDHALMESLFEAGAAYALSAPPDVGVEDVRRAMSAAILVANIGGAAGSEGLMREARRTAERFAS